MMTWDEVRQQGENTSRGKVGVEEAKLIVHDQEAERMKERKGRKGSGGVGWIDA